MAEAADPEPPRGCTSTEGYSGDYWAKLTLCLTVHHDKRYNSAYGTWEDRSTPAFTIEAECSHKNLGVWSPRDCYFDADLTTKKDGAFVKSVEVVKRTDWAHTQNVKLTGSWSCQGHGAYSMTLDNIKMRAQDTSIQGGRWVQVPVGPATVKGTGC